MALAMFYVFNKRYNSTKRPSDLVSYNIQVALKMPTSLHNPTLQISVVNITMENMLKFNYCMFENQYYWITDRRIISNTILEFDMEEDVLATYTEEILATKAFILYSASNGTTSLIDNRIVNSTEWTFVKGIRPSSQFDFLQTEGNGCFALTVANGATTQGGGCTYLLSYNELAPIMQDMFSGNVWENLQKSLFKPMDFVIKLMWFPCSKPTLLQYYKYALNEPILIGQFDAQQTGTVIVWGETQSAVTVLDFTDYLNHNYAYDIRNTKVVLSLPLVGVVDLNTNLLAKGTLTIRATIDIYAGVILYELLYNIENSEGSIALEQYRTRYGCEMPMTASTYNPLQVLSATTSSLLAVQNESTLKNPNMLGTSIAAASNIANSITGLVPRGGFVGTIGSRVDYVFNADIGASIYRNKLSDGTMDIQDVLGLPLSATETIGNLTGYIQTQNVSVSIEATLEEIEKVNSLLDGGVYIE